MDDWEVGLFSGKSRARQLVALIDPSRVNSFPSTQRLDRSITSYPHRTVSNTWLQERFGGLLLPHLGRATLETLVAMGMRALENLELFFGGRAVRDRVG